MRQKAQNGTLDAKVDCTALYLRVSTDAGISGTSTDGRVALSELLAAARAAAITRNMRDFLGIVTALDAARCGLMLMAESFDTGTPRASLR